MARRVALAAAALVALTAGALWWWPTVQDHTAGPAGTQATSLRPGLRGGAADPDRPAGLLPAGRPASTDDPFLTPQLRQQLEALLLEAGQADSPAELKRRLAALVGRHFPSEFATRALALAERYVDYRVALGGLKPPADAGDPRALRSALDARQRVREQHFSAEEYEALFGEGDALDRYTVARLEIERNDALSAAQKQAALREAEQQLGPELRAQRNQAIAHLGVAAQTAAWDAQGLGDNERYAQRSAQHGPDAAQRLAALDREERDWQARLALYANAQARGEGASTLEPLRQQLFSPAEQLRLDAALALRSQVSTAKP